VALAVVYLPVYAEDARYYWVALPFLLAASFGWVLHLAGGRSRRRTLALALVTGSFVIGHAGQFSRTFAPSPERDYLAAQVLADKLITAGLGGPVAAVEAGHRTALYVAYLLHVPWFGQREYVADTAEILASGAALVIVPRGTVTARQLRQDTRFTSADKELFGCAATEEAAPFEVYLTRARSPHDMCSESGP
jgi:hypothetical protein